MYIIKNAIKSITRNKGRNLMILIIALVIAVSACVSLSIRQAAETAKADTMANLSIKAQLSFDRTSVMKTQNNVSQDGGFNRQKFDFAALTGNSLTLDDYYKYVGLLSENDGYYYTLSASMNAGEGLLAYGSEVESEDAVDTEDVPASDGGFLIYEENETDTYHGQNDGISGMKGKKSLFNTADFSLTGYSSYDAMLSLFGDGGTHTITSGSVFDENATDMTCIISDELAMYNDLNVGATITLVNPNATDEAYLLTICGLYTNTASDTGNSRFVMVDPANYIYLSSASLQAIVNASADANPADSDNTVSAVTAEIAFTYVLANADNYERFRTLAEEAGLPESYTLSSTELTAYENRLIPLNTLGNMTGCFFLIVLTIGSIILVIINIFNLRERKYEVGVLTAIGMKKSKVALQFVCELFLITFIAIILGAGIGASVSVPVTNTLLKQQVEKAQASDEQLDSNFGIPGGKMNGRFNQRTGTQQVSYITSVSSATNLTVIFEMVLVGLLLTVISSTAAMVTIMRYEPLRILSDRS